MIYSSFESSHQDESNGGNFVLLRSLDGQIFDETSKSVFYIYDTATFDVLLNISPSNDHRRLYHSSFESSHQGESNGSKFILLQSPDGQIFDETSKISIFVV